MKEIFFLLILISSNIAFSQKSSDQREILLNKIKTYQDSINFINDYHQNRISSYNDSIKNIQLRINKLMSQEASNIDSDISLTVSVERGAVIKEKPEGLSDILFEFDEDDKLVLLDYINEHFQVCKDSICGYISEVWIEQSNDIDAISSKKAILQEIQDQKNIKNSNIILAKYGNILIEELRVTGANSADGVGFNIKWRYFNYSKTIKYMQVTVVPYNAVGDIQISKIGGKSAFIGRITGPIDADVINTNSAYWENAWYNNTVTCVKITKVRVEYIDGSTNTYINEIPKILADDIENDCHYEN